MFGQLRERVSITLGRRREVFTSSGVSAGMNLALGLMAKLFDHATTDGVARGADYDWNSEQGRDPFAVI
jgi:transcriptional regulator GlxA family with amidase domain